MGLDPSTFGAFISRFSKIKFASSTSSSFSSSVQDSSCSALPSSASSFILVNIPKSCWASSNAVSSVVVGVGRVGAASAVVGVVVVVVVIAVVVVTKFGDAAVRDTEDGFGRNGVKLLESGGITPELLVEDGRWSVGEVEE